MLFIAETSHREKDSSSAWNNEELETLLDIFSKETIEFTLEEAKCPKDKNAV